MNKIIIELTEGDQARLDRLAAALDRLADEYHAMTTGTVLVDTPRKTETPTEAPSEPAAAPTVEGVKDTAPEPVKPAESSTEAPAATQYTKADVQSRVVALCANPDTKRAVKHIINEYAARVSEIPEDKYPEIIAKLDLLAMEG